MKKTGHTLGTLDSNFLILKTKKVIKYNVNDSWKGRSIPLGTATMKYFVYLLVSKKNSKIFSYVGMTKDLNKRITLHNSSKGAKYTKGKKWFLAYKKSYNSKSKALKEEYRLKKDKKKREKIKLNFYFKNENFNSFTI